MANGFLTGTATLTNGSKTMTLDGGVDATFVTSGSHIYLDGFMPIEGLSGSLGEILLRYDWPNATTSNVKFVITYTIEGLVDAVEKSRLISIDWANSVESVDAIVASASTAVQDIAEVQGDVIQAQDDLLAIDGTLQSYVSAASTSESNASADATKSQEYAVNPYSVVVPGTGDLSSLHHATDSKAAKVIAVDAKDDTVVLKSDVETLKTQTTDIYDDAYALATSGEDVEIATGVYGLKHYAIKAQAAAAAAQSAVASVTAALYFVGVWDASNNTAPPAPSGDGNPFYKISVAGTFSGNDYAPNDQAIWDSINTTWIKIDNTESVVTVNGKSGAVVLAVADIAGLQSTLDTLQNNIDSKVAQADLEMNIHIKQWAFIV